MTKGNLRGGEDRSQSFSISYLRKRDWYGDPPGAGKIWENQFYTGKKDHHGAKCTQIDEGMCQGVICTCQNFFPFTNLAAGVTFLKVIFQFPKKVLNRSFLISLAVFSYLSPPVFLTSLPHHCYIPTALSAIAWRRMVQKKRDFGQY